LVVARHCDVATPTDDIVHFDLNLTNLLQLDGRISGVVDWDGVCAGDRAFDLATLLFYAHDQVSVRNTLWHHLTTITNPAAVTVYLAHLCHRQVDWSLRHHNEASIQRWLDHVRSVLQEIPTRTGCAVPAWP
jgi:thiamine kinase-like enzyme